MNKNIGQVIYIQYYNVANLHCITITSRAIGIGTRGQGGMAPEFVTSPNEIDFCHTK